MDGIGAAKYAFKLASGAVGILILLIVAGPIAGAVSPQLGTGHDLGLGIELQSIQSQLQQILSSGSTIVGTHVVLVPAFNNWPLPGRASLFLTLVVGNRTVYQTQTATVQLAPFRSGVLNVSIIVSPSLLLRIEGQQLVGKTTVGVSGAMSLSEERFWTVTVTFPQE